ncbi:MAG: hypothetical protein HYX66_00805 [Ignavibacteria bacterium]|nr:hypothetical protein [Ignavibacteria bacterium]
MAQQSPERPNIPPHGDPADRPYDMPDSDRPELREGIEASMKQMWEIVRKSTDVIVALREENAILRSELSALRKSERQMHDRLEEFLQRIATLEEQRARPEMAEAPNTVSIDRLEDKVVELPGDFSDSGEAQKDRKAGKVLAVPSQVPRNITITVTIRDDERSVGADQVDSTVRSIVAAATTALGALSPGSR